jgi:hypothetical protein
MGESHRGREKESDCTCDRQEACEGRELKHEHDYNHKFFTEEDDNWKYSVVQCKCGEKLYFHFAPKQKPNHVSKPETLPMTYRSETVEDQSVFYFKDGTYCIDYSNGNYSCTIQVGERDVDGVTVKEKETYTCWSNLRGNGEKEIIKLVVARVRGLQERKACQKS